MRLINTTVAAFFAAGVSAPARAPSTPGARPNYYPIRGFWMYARPRRVLWQKSLDRIRGLGADTVIQFGPRLTRVTRQKLASEPSRYPLCSKLLERLDARLEAARASAKLRYILVLNSYENFGPDLLRSPPWDARLQTGRIVVTRLVVPVPENTEKAGAALRFDPEATQRFDLVFLVGHSNDSVAFLLEEASRRRMHVFVGLPAPPAHPRYPWDPWNQVMPTYLDVTDRILQDYAIRFRNLAAFIGVYHTLETPAQDRCLGAVLACYRECNQRVRRRLPGKRILVSPYWDARRRKPTGAPAGAVYRGILALGRTGVDIIAPQDGRGTGKVALFWPDQARLPAPHSLEIVDGVGKSTYGEAYFGSTRDFYRAARRAVDRLARDGISVRLWANLEAFEPGRGVPCGTFTTTQRTSKTRLDRAIMFAGPYPAKLISYMWDGYYTCPGGRDQTLAEEIAADMERPILVDARPEPRNARPGLSLLGYHLAAGVLEIRKAVPGARNPGDIHRVPLEFIDPGFGKKHRSRYPEFLERAWAPWSGSAPTAAEVRCCTRAGRSPWLYLAPGE